MMREALALSPHNFTVPNGDDFFFNEKKNIVSVMFFVKEINRLNNTYDIEIIYGLYWDIFGEEVSLPEMTEFLAKNIQLDEVGFYVIEKLDAGSLNKKSFMKSTIRRASLYEIETL